MRWNTKGVLLKLGAQQISVSLVGEKTEMILCNIKDLEKQKHFMRDLSVLEILTWKISCSLIFSSIIVLSCYHRSLCICQ